MDLGHCVALGARIKQAESMGFAVRVRSAGQKYGPTCHQRDRADITEFVTLVRLSSLGQHVGVLALAGYKRRKSALTAGPISTESMRRDKRTKERVLFCLIFTLFDRTFGAELNFV